MTILLDMTYPLADDTHAAVRVLVADVQTLMEDEAAQTLALDRLSPQRREKVQAIKNRRSRTLSIGVALLLDQLLQPLGWRERDMVYVEGEHGKPEFQNCPLPFNLSHSGSVAAAAMLQPLSRPLSTLPRGGENPCRWLALPPTGGAGRGALGLDIQRITRYRPELVRRVFGAEERAALAACTTEAERECCFTQFWCRAEAYAKATGRGLQWPVPTPPPTAHFITLPLSDDYCGCLCLLDLSATLTHEQGK